MKYPKTRIIKYKGITLLYTKHAINNSTTLEFGINSGAIGEKIPGLAHFFEHMLFKGTTNRNNEQMSEDIREYIQMCNAYTTPDTVAMCIVQSSEKLEKEIEIMTDMFFNSIFDKNEIKKEREVVLQEILRADQFMERKANYDLYNLAYYYPEDLHYTPLGTKESISKITQKDFLEFRKKNFCRENFFISFATNKPLSKIKTLIDKYFLTKLESNPNFIPNKKNNDFIQNKNSGMHIEHWKDHEKIFMEIAISCHKKERTYDYKIPYIVDACIGLKSRVFKLFREDNQLVYGVPRLSFNLRNNDGLLILDIQTSKDNINKCIEISAKLFDDLKNNGLTKDEFRRFQKQIMYTEDEMVLIPEFIERRAYWQYSKYESIETNKQSNKLTLAQKQESINEYIKSVFTSDKIYVSIAGTIQPTDVYSLAKIKKLFNIKQ